MPGAPGTCEAILKAHIDCPFFQNHPVYLALWRRHYLATQDPQILLLMHHKRIGVYHHWLHAALAKHFVRIQKAEIASFILKEALKASVFGAEALQQMLGALPSFEPRYSRGDLLGLLNQKNIRALGTVWNRFAERFFYEQHLPGGCCCFAEAALARYSLRGTNKAAVPPNGMRFVGELEPPLRRLWVAYTAEDDRSECGETQPAPEACSDIANTQSPTISQDKNKENAQPSRASAARLLNANKTSNEESVEITEEETQANNSHCNCIGEPRTATPVEDIHAIVASSSEPLISSPARTDSSSEASSEAVDGIAEPSESTAPMNERAVPSFLKDQPVLTLAVGQEFKISEFTYITQSVTEKYATAFRISSAHSTATNETIAARSVLLCPVSAAAACVLFKIKPDTVFCRTRTVEIQEEGGDELPRSSRESLGGTQLAEGSLVTGNNDVIRVVVECDVLVDLNTVLKTSSCEIATYYLCNVMEIFEDYLKKSVKIASPEFIIDPNFKLHLVRFELSEALCSADTEETCALEINRLFAGISGLQAVAPGLFTGSGLEDKIKELKEEISGRAHRLALLRHKSALLDAYAEA